MVAIVFQDTVISNSRNIRSNSHSFLKIKKGPQVLPVFEVPDILKKGKAPKQGYKNCDKF